MRIKSASLPALLLVVLSLFFNAPYAQSVPVGGSGLVVPQFCSNPQLLSGIFSSTGKELGLALIALTVSFDVVAIAFLLSRIFTNAGLRSWVQGEYWEIMKSALIIVVIYSAMIIVGNIAYTISSPLGGAGSVAQPGGGINLAPLIMGAENYLCNVNTQMAYAWESMGIMSGGTGFWSTFQMGFYVPIPIGPFFAIYDGVMFLPFANWLLQTGNFMIAWYGSIINDMVNFILFPFSSLVIGLITTLPSFAYIGLNFFIPMGLIFRALPFIRGIGGTLIAIGIALCLVLPATFILFNSIATNMMASAIPIVQTQPPLYAFGQNSCNSFFSVFTSWGSSLICNTLNVGGISQLAANIAGSIWDALVVFQTNAIYTYMNRILLFGVYLIIQMLLFVIDLIIMYPLVDSIARSLGGTIRLSLGGKLRLAS